MFRAYIILFILTAVSAITQINAAGLKISGDDTASAIARLDRTLDRRDSFIAARIHTIDSLKQAYADNPDRRLLISIGDCYTSFDNDSALTYFDRAISASAISEESLEPQLKRLALLPLSGIFDSAANDYQAIDSSIVSPAMRPLYYESGRKLYSYIASAYSGHKPYYDLYTKMALQCQSRLLAFLDKDSDDYLFNLAEYNFLTGETSKANALLGSVVARSVDKGLLARAHHHLSTMARQHGDNDAYKYHLANSAVADIESATLEVISLQELGNAIYADGDIDRAYRYLSTALDNAVNCGASLRMIESSKALPLIAKAHNGQIASWRRTIYIILGILFILLLGFAVTLVVLYREMKRMKQLQMSLRRANSSKNIYISQFLKLCSIYTDKLNQFCKIAERKISAGKVDEFYRMTKSGKFIEDQNSEFYEVFDNAFLHLYPDFVSEVNKLLRPDCRISLKEGESLNTDLRILAITRMGIDDAASIAQILNFSLNTIYAYRNRMKGRAINRDTFEQDIMAINSAD